ncbi:ferredoxin [Amycolatopsis acidicola]|uniref:Ferredoxin n=1 Tax=Amycolatopsis acidicola TaxID=2596893 RepID=A0A5N0V272_9PSEU|nr:ferredoxin [Amycolatopsis acidicola]KAA9160527.1 ferredoxin [Amycolatopsis acidicola]
MKVKVDMDVCEDHGQCVFAAPDIFEFDDNDVLVWNESPGEQSRDAVRFAATSCPVRAITIED